MKLLKSNLIILASASLLFLEACSNGDQAAKTETTPATSSSTTQSSAPTPSASAVAKTEAQHGESHGGQIVETGTYHLEFVPEKEADKTHMDFYLLKGDNHETIPNAKVTAQVQLPDGKQKTVPFTYDAKDKHYTALLTEKATGQYQVKISADVKGEKLNGRFNFNQ